MAFDGLKEAGQTIGAAKEVSSLFRRAGDDARTFVLGQVERIIVNLDSIRDALDALDVRAEIKLKYFSREIDAASMTWDFDGPAKGYSWIVKHFDFQGSAVNNTLKFYINDRPALTTGTTAADGMITTNPVEYWVPPSARLRIVIGPGQVIGEKLRLWLQVEETKVEKNYG